MRMPHSFLGKTSPFRVPTHSRGILSTRCFIFCEHVGLENPIIRRKRSPRSPLLPLLLFMSFLRPASNRGGKWLGNMYMAFISFSFLALLPLLDTRTCRPSGAFSPLPPPPPSFPPLPLSVLPSLCSAAFTQDPSQIDGVFARLLHFVALILWRRHSLKWMNPFPKDIHFAGVDRNAPSDSWWSVREVLGCHSIGIASPDSVSIHV